MAYISVELITGTKHAIDDEYPSLVARINTAREQGKLVQLTLWGGVGEIQVNPEHIASIQPMPTG